MQTRTVTTAFVVTVSLLWSGRGVANSVPQPASGPRYVYFTLHSNMIARLSPRQEVLEVPVDAELQRLPLREALRRLFGRLKQEYIIEGTFPDDTRITLRRKGMLLSLALDELASQTGGRWVQELWNGRPTIRFHRNQMPMTIHLPATPELLKQVAPLEQNRPSREPTEAEIRKLSLGQVAADGRGRNILGRRGIPSLIIP